MLDADKLSWSLTLNPCDLDPDVAAYEFASESERPALLAVLKSDVAAGMAWRWCDVEVSCVMPGANFLAGSSTRRAASYKDQREFEELGDYDAMRREAVADLERRVSAVVVCYEAHSAAAEDEADSVPDFSVGDVVYCILDDPPVRGVVDPGGLDGARTAYVRYDCGAGPAVEDVRNLRPWPPPGV